MLFIILLILRSVLGAVDLSLPISYVPQPFSTSTDSGCPSNSLGLSACERSDISDPRVYVNGALFDGGLKDLSNPETIRNLTELANVCYDGKFYTQVGETLEEDCEACELEFMRCQRKKCCRKVEGIMINVNAPSVDDDYNRLRRLFRRLRLKAGCNVMANTPADDLTGGVNFSRAIQEEAIQRMIAKLDRCVTLGGKVMTGPWVIPLRDRPNITDPNQLVDHINARLKFGLPAIKSVVQAAVQRGISIRIEYLTSSVVIGPNYLPQTIALCELVRQTPPLINPVPELRNVTCGIDVDTRHEILSWTNGPTLLGGLFQYMQLHGLSFDISPGDPDRGSLVDSWNPWSRVYPAAQAIGFTDIIAIAIFQSTPQNVVNLGQTRRPFVDPLQVMKDSVKVTLIQWEKAPISAREFPPETYPQSVELVREFREEIDNAQIPQN